MMTDTSQVPDIKSHFDVLKNRHLPLPFEKRKAYIKKILNLLNDEETVHNITTALHKDMGKPRQEAELTEVATVIMTARHALRHMSSWVKDKPVPVPTVLKGLQSYIRYEPKGTALVISPWNYPFQLTFNPLIHAIAAGNKVIVKPSEISAHTSTVIAEMIDTIFDHDDVLCIEGGVDVSTDLLRQPFDHIFFTGSPQIGKIVMGAAAKNLSSCTLELGGKSPAFIDRNVDLKDAAYKIAWSKVINCGQTCIAPDYLLVHSSDKEAFVAVYKTAVSRLLGDDIAKSECYGRIISDKHYNRITALLDDAVLKGAQIQEGGDVDASHRFIAPALLTNVNESMDIMHEEIFGPLLPVITYNTIDEAIEIIQRQPKPLSFYIFSKRQKTADDIMARCPAGGTCINDVLLGTAVPDLPFGGINNSGIGKTNGFHGFVEFSNERGIVKRKWGTLSLIYPPYTKWTGRLIGLMKKIP